MVVANRLPFDLKREDDGSTTARQAPGGLVTALAPICSRSRTASGSAGREPPTSSSSRPPPTASRCYPVPLSEAEVDGYYEGFSNGTLWPLYHDAVVASEFHRAVVGGLPEGEPAVRRGRGRGRRAGRDRLGARLPTAAGPADAAAAAARSSGSASSCTSRSRPTSCSSGCRGRAEIITGLLGADLIGFQLPGGARNFARLARSLTGAAASGGTIEHDGRTVRAGAFPISIDSAGPVGTGRRPAVQGRSSTAAGRPRQSSQDHPGRRPAGLHQGHRRPAAGVRRAARRGRSGGRGRRDGADRHPEPGAAGLLRADARGDRAAGRVRSTATSAGSAGPPCTTCTSPCPARTWPRSTWPPT